jgi:NADH:ubiquinone oxidoreductase subunit H
VTEGTSIVETFFNEHPHALTAPKLISYIVIQGVLAIVYMLILTIVIAAITLVERKTLALVQRRVGPNQTAFRGRLQYLADATKLLNKSIYVLRDSGRWLLILWPCLALVSAYLF